MPPPKKNNYSGGTLKCWALRAEPPVSLRFRNPAVVKKNKKLKKKRFSKSWTSLQGKLFIFISLIKQEYLYLIGTNFNACIHISRQPNWIESNGDSSSFFSLLKVQKCLLCFLVRLHGSTRGMLCFALACLFSINLKRDKHEKVNIFTGWEQTVGLNRIKQLQEWLICSS